MQVELQALPMQLLFINFSVLVVMLELAFCMKIDFIHHRKTNALTSASKKKNLPVEPNSQFLIPSFYFKSNSSFACSYSHIHI